MMSVQSLNAPLSETIIFSERDWQRFIAALEEDREPTEAAKKAAERYNEWQPRC